MSKSDPEKKEFDPTFWPFGGRSRLDGVGRWIYMPWVYAWGTVLGLVALGWPFFFLHGTARAVAALVWYALLAWVTAEVLAYRKREAEKKRNRFHG